MKKIIKNYLYNVIYQMLLIIIPLITMPYKARVLGPNNIGIYSYVYTVFTYLLMIATLGINTYGRREISYIRDNKYQKSKVLYEILILKFITILSTIIIFMVFLGLKSPYCKFYIIMNIDILFNALDITWFFQGLEEFKRISIINIIIKVINIICIFLFIQQENDLLIYFIITALFDILTILTLIIFIPKNLQKIKLKELQPIKHLKNSLILFIPQIFIQIYTVCDKLMLGLLAINISEVGFYEYTSKIVVMSLNLISALTLVMIPAVSNEFAKNNQEKIKEYMEKSIHFVSLIGIPIIMGLLAISNNLVLNVFGEEYKKIITLLKIMPLIIIPCGITTIIGEQYLVSTKQEKRFTIYIMIGALTNIILNLILIPKYESMGAVISTVITETLILIIELPIIKKFITKNTLISSIKYLIASIIMFIIISIFGKINENIITLIMQIIIGVSLYGLLLIILKDNYTKEIINQIHKK